MDENCYEILSRLALPEINVIRLEEFEKADNELLAAKQNRSRIEYYFTCTPSLPIYVFKDCREADVVTYLDADLYFFRDPHELYAEFDGNSIGIIEHRFAPKLRHWHQYGIYNVGWVMFRRGENAMACLQWWRQRCIEWCYDQVEADRFADQKYLNCWPKQFQQVAVLQHKGANLAPWNLENYEIRWRDDEISVDDEPLIFFHFHNLKHLQGRIYDLGLADYQHAQVPRVVRRGIYKPYLQVLLIAGSNVRPIAAKQIPLTGIRWESGVNAAESSLSLPRRLWRQLRWRFSLCKGLLQGRYIHVARKQFL